MSTIVLREATIRYRNPKRAPAQIGNSTEAAAFMRKVIDGDPREHSFALYLDSDFRPLAYSIVSIGNSTMCLAGPREVYAPALMVGAHAVVVGHNHPSGHRTPSDADLEAAAALESAGDLLGVLFVDSLVVTETDHTSLREYVTRKDAA